MNNANENDERSAPDREHYEAGLKVSGLLAGQGGEKGSPIVLLAELLEITKVGKSKAYRLMNPKKPDYDPEFPTGFPLFDSPRSPKAYWRCEAIAWVQGRSRKFREEKGRVRNECLG